MTKRLLKLIKWLTQDYDDWQIFYCRNLVGDPTITIYDEDDIQVDVCYEWEYLEIFGLTKEEQDALCEEGEHL